MKLSGRCGLLDTVHTVRQCRPNLPRPSGGAMTWQTLHPMLTFFMWAGIVIGAVAVLCAIVGAVSILIDRRAARKATRPALGLVLLSPDVPSRANRWR